MFGYFMIMKGTLYNKDHLSFLLQSLMALWAGASSPETPLLPVHSPSAPSTSESSSSERGASQTRCSLNRIKSNRNSPKCKRLMILAQWVLRFAESEGPRAKLYKNLDQITRYFGSTWRAQAFLRFQVLPDVLWSMEAHSPPALKSSSLISKTLFL